MTPSEYEAFVRETREAHDDETAARLIEQRCHPPYRPPVRIDVGYARAAARKGTLAVTESAQGVTGVQDGAA